MSSYSGWSRYRREHFDKAALMAKKALLIPVDKKNDDPYYENMERELLERINELGIGPQGFGGRTTALAVKIIAAPTILQGCLLR